MRNYCQILNCRNVSHRGIAPVQRENEKIEVKEISHVNSSAMNYFNYLVT